MAVMWWFPNAALPKPHPALMVGDRHTAQRFSSFDIYDMLGNRDRRPISAYDKAHMPAAYRYGGVPALSAVQQPYVSKLVVFSRRYL